MKKLALLQIILAGILWGTSGIFVRLLSPIGLSSQQLTFLRSTVAFIAMALYILICNKDLFKVRIKELLLFSGSGLSFFLTSSFYYYSMQATSISTAVVLMYTAPVFVLIYSVMFLGERLTSTKVIAIVCMIIGSGLVSGIVGDLKFDLLGVSAGLAAGIAYSSYNIFTKVAMKNKCNPFSATLYCFAFAAIIGGLVCGVDEVPVLLLKKLEMGIPLVVGLGIFTCILPYFLYTLALRHIHAGMATALGILEPMSATLFGIILFREPMGISTICGVVLILGAVFILAKSGD